MPLASVAAGHDTLAARNEPLTATAPGVAGFVVSPTGVSSRCQRPPHGPWRPVPHCPSPASGLNGIGVGSPPWVSRPSWPPQYVLSGVPSALVSSATTANGP